MNHHLTMMQQQNEQQQMLLPSFSSSFLLIAPGPDSFVPTSTMTSASTLDSALMPPPMLPPPLPQPQPSQRPAAQSQAKAPSKGQGGARPRAGRPAARAAPVVSLSPEELAKVEERRARNRLAARKCRDNKLAKIEVLRTSLAEVKEQNEREEEEIAHLEGRLTQLRRMIAQLCLKPALGENVVVPVLSVEGAPVPDLLHLLQVLVVYPAEGSGDGNTSPKILITTFRGDAFALGNRPDALTPVKIIQTGADESEVVIVEDTAPADAPAVVEQNQEQQQQQQQLVEGNQIVYY